MMIYFFFFILHGNFVGFFCFLNLFCFDFWKVNGISLLGENHKDVVNILKELPIKVTMVCCREAAPSVNQSVIDECQTTEQVIQHNNMCLVCFGLCDSVLQFCFAIHDVGIQKLVTILPIIRKCVKTDKKILYDCTLETCRVIKPL